VVVIAFAVPGIDRATARAEMAAATEHVRYSIDTARKLARTTESSVTVQADTPDGSMTRHIRLSGPGLGAALTAPDYRVPDNIRLVPEHATFTFDARGLVRNPGTLLLVSEVDDAIFTELRVD
jgi:Tfp pilus assembly protein FimT